MADKTSVMKGGKPVLCKTRNITRTMTAGTQLVTLPRGSRILGFVLTGVASNAGTTATLSLGSTAASSNEFVSAVSVLSGGVGNGVNLLNGVAGAVGAGQGSPATADIQVFAKYAETGGASSTGSWKVHILYTVGNVTNDDTI